MADNFTVNFTEMLVHAHAKGTRPLFPPPRPGYEASHVTTCDCDQINQQRLCCYVICLHCMLHDRKNIKSIKRCEFLCLRVEVLIKL